MSPTQSTNPFRLREYTPILNLENNPTQFSKLDQSKGVNQEQTNPNLYGNTTDQRAQATTLNERNIKFEFN